LYHPRIENSNTLLGMCIIEVGEHFV